MFPDSIKTNNVILTYKVCFSDIGYKFHELAYKFAEITVLSSRLNFDFLSIEPDYIDKILEYNVIDDESGLGFIKLAIPPELCGIKEGFPLLLSTALYISVYKFVKSIELCDIDFPPTFSNNFIGPKNGINGIRKILSVQDRPLIGLVLKPRYGLSLSLCKKIAKVASVSGIDYIIDDELIVDPSFCSAKDRIVAIRNAIEEGNNTCGNKTAYIMNATSHGKHFEYLLDLAINNNVDGIMVNPIFMGFDAISGLRENQDISQFIVANSIGRGVFTNGNYKINENIICLLSRLAGADAIYTSTYHAALKSKGGDIKKISNVLHQKIYNLRRSFAISSGGINVNNLLPTLKQHGNDVMIQMGESLCKLINVKKDIKLFVDAIHLLTTEYIKENDESKVYTNVMEKFPSRLIKALDEMGWRGEQS